MTAIRARVRDGRLVVDEPCDLPEGAEVELTVSAVGSASRFAAAIEAGLADATAGRVIEHDEVGRRLALKFGRLPQ